MTTKIYSIGSIPLDQELEEAVAGGLIPIKFCYPEEGGDRWDQLRQEEGYTLGDREFTALIDALSKVHLDRPTNIIHLGVGNGIEIPALAKTFDFKVHNYIGVDISQRMISNTLRYHSAELEDMRSAYFVLSDIEAAGNLEKICEDAKRRGYRQNLVLVIGQGVLSSNPRFFGLVSQSLKEEDSALITLEGDDPLKRTEVLSTYDLKSVQDLLKVGLGRAGISEGFFLPARFNEQLHQVELYFKSADGREFLCLTSYKPSSSEELKETLAQRGLTPITVDYNLLTHTYAALCRGGKDV